MKLILAVMPTSLSDDVSKELLDKDFRVTKFADTAGLLTGGTTTLMVGLQASRLEDCLDLIRAQIPPLEDPDPDQARVTIYVLNIRDFAKV